MNAAARLLNQGSLSRGWVVGVFLASFPWMTVLLASLTLFSALSLVYVTHYSRALNADIQQLLDEKDRLHVQWGHLLLEKSSLLMQSRVEAMAEQHMDMVLPDGKMVVVVK